MRTTGRTYILFNFRLVKTGSSHGISLQIKQRRRSERAAPHLVRFVDRLMYSLSPNAPRISGKESKLLNLSITLLIIFHDIISTDGAVRRSLGMLR